MLTVEFSSQAARFLNKAHTGLAVRLVRRIEALCLEPFPTDVKRVLNRPEKVFRIRVGDYRIEYVVVYDRSLLFITSIEKRERAY